MSQSRLEKLTKAYGRPRRRLGIAGRIVGGAMVIREPKLSRISDFRLSRSRRMYGGPFLLLRDAPAEAAFFPLATLRLSLDFRSSIVNKRGLKRMPQGCPCRDCACLFKKIIVSSGGMRRS